MYSTCDTTPPDGGSGEKSGAMRLAIITARGGSKGLPGKNLMTIGGRTLVRRAVDSAIASGRFDMVVCSSDNPDIIESAVAGGAVAPFVRPDYLSNDSATSMDVIFHAMDFISERHQRAIDIVCLCEPTSPLRSAADVKAAVDMLYANPNADGVVSVCECDHAHPAWLQQIDGDGNLGRYFPEMPFPTRRQDFDQLPKPYMLNGAVYVARAEALRREKSFLTPRTLGYVMPPERSVNIDSALDMTIARAVYAESKSEK